MRPYRYIYILLFPILLLILGTAWYGCSGLKTSSKKILVIHQYADTPENYGLQVEDAYSDEMKDLGIHADVRHIYLDWPHVELDSSAHEILIPALDSLKKKGWKPDVIITHQDWAAHEALRLFAEDDQHWLHGTPIVAVGVEYGDSIFSIWKGKNVLTGFHNDIDLYKNLLFCQEITGSNDASIELDQLPHMDAVIRERLKRTLRDTTRYIDNSDFHIDEQDTLLWQRIMESKHILVNVLSVYSPELNCPPDSSVHRDSLIDRNRWRYDAMLRFAKDNNWIQLRYALACNIINIKSRKPQFSVVNAQFGNDRQYILGGYFPTLSTEVNDALTYADKILQGAQPSQLPIGLHRNTYNLDYKAMELRGLDYKHWSMHADVIINTPFKVERPWLYWLLFGGGILLALVIIIFVAWEVNQFIFNNKQVKFLLQRQQHNNWLFSNTNSAFFKLSGKRLTYTAFIASGNPNKTDTVESLIRHTHPDDQDIMTNFLTFNEDEGKHLIRVRLIDPATGKYHWWAWEYRLTSEGTSHHIIEGTVTNIDRQKQEEEQLIKDKQEAEETNIKEAFLANMTHDIRTPLNCITSFTSMLTDENMQLGDEERQMCFDTIKQNTQVLLKLLSDVSSISDKRMGEYRYIYNKVAVVDLITQAYQTNLVLMPEGIVFNVEMDEDAFMYIDRDRTIQVLNNFLSNAIKHTTQGSITIGWHIETEQNEQGAAQRYIHIYVTDTGEGISEADQKQVFERFYKTTESNTGTGLGLNICSTIVKAQGGTIGVESELGKGSTFWARFKEYQKDTNESQANKKPNTGDSTPTQNNPDSTQPS